MQPGPVAAAAVDVPAIRPYRRAIVLPVAGSDGRGLGRRLGLTPINLRNELRTLE